MLKQLQRNVGYIKEVHVIGVSSAVMWDLRATNHVGMLA